MAQREGLVHRKLIEHLKQGSVADGDSPLEKPEGFYEYRQLPTGHG